MEGLGISDDERCAEFFDGQQDFTSMKHSVAVWGYRAKIGYRIKFVFAIGQGQRL